METPKPTQQNQSRRVDPAGRVEVEDVGETYGYGRAATISRYASSVKARSVSVDTLPAEPIASDDAPDGFPVDADQPGQRGLVHRGGQVADHVLEVAGEQ